jgi:hypothetical protein
MEPTGSGFVFSTENATSRAISGLFLDGFYGKSETIEWLYSPIDSGPH